MTRYVCDKGHTFIHTAQRVILGLEKPELTTLDGLLETFPGDKELEPLLEIFRKLRKSFDFAQLEQHCCPFCQSLTYTEVAEADYADWAQVQHSQVKEKLDQGWKVLSHTKDSVTMAKCREEHNRSV